MPYAPYVIPLLITAAISAGLALYCWLRRIAAGTGRVALLMLAVSTWALSYALELGNNSLSAKVFWAKVEYLGITAIPVLWFTFALQYTGRERWLTRRNHLLFAIEPLVTLLLVWTNEAHGLIWQAPTLDTNGSFPMLVVTPYGAWFWVNWAYSYTLLALGTGLLALQLIKSHQLYRKQLAVVLAGLFAPWLGNAVYILRLSPFPDLDLTPFGYTLTGLAITWGLFRLRLFDIVPVAREAVIAELPDGVIVLDTENRIVDLNPAAQRIIGRQEEIIGQSVVLVLSGRPDVIDHFRATTEARGEIILGGGQAQGVYDLHTLPLHDRRGRLTGRLVMLHDVTDRKRLFQSIADERSQLQALIESSRDGIILIGVNQRVLVINATAVELLHLGGQPEDWTDRPIQDALDVLRQHAPSVVQATLAEMRRVQKGNESAGEGEYEVPPRQLHWLNLPVISGTTPLGRLWVLRDVTQERLLERMRNDLTRTLVHDLRNPLTSISVSLEFLAEMLADTATPTQQQMINIARQNAEKMLELVSAILDISRLESGQMPVERSATSLGDLVAGVVESQLPLVAGKGLHLENEVPPDLPPAYADAALIERVLRNLIGNAVKFTPTGGTIRVTATADTSGERRLSVSVSDTGPGIAPEIREQLFQKFVTGMQEERGSGLGLAFCRMAIEAHGERIWVENPPEGGTTLTFTLPALLADPEHPQ